MQYVLTILPAVACGAMVLVCARMMSRGRGAPPDEASTRAEVRALRKEVERLRAERRADDHDDVARPKG